MTRAVGRPGGLLGRLLAGGGFLPVESGGRIGSRGPELDHNVDGLVGIPLQQVHLNYDLEYQSNAIKFEIIKLFRDCKRFTRNNNYEALEKVEEELHSYLDKLASCP